MDDVSQVEDAADIRLSTHSIAWPHNIAELPEEMSTADADDPFAPADSQYQRGAECLPEPKRDSSACEFDKN